MSLPATLALAPLSLLYGAAVRARLALYHRGALLTRRISAPVISIGNITAGGTGKTPMVAWTARVAAAAGRRVCVLTRGYGRVDAGARVVVSDGERLLADARAGGDEPRLLAEELQGEAAVISDANRAVAARWAQENLRSDAFVLDDGFQHLALARDLDIVTVDATSPWGGGRLLPRGRLREPLAGLKRADCIIITRAEQASDLVGLRAETQRLSDGRAEVFIARTRALRARPVDGSGAGNLLAETAPADEAATDKISADKTAARPVTPALRLAALPQMVAAFCALGNPPAFFAHLRREGFALSFTRAFPDHHYYSQRDADALAQAAAASGAQALLTTTKDAVKLRALRFALPCYALEMELEIEDEERLRALIRTALARAGAS